MFIFFAGFLAFMALMLSGCPSSTSTPAADIGRIAYGLRLDTVPAQHPFCLDPTPAFASTEACQKAPKFKATWDRPNDTVDLKGYRFYLDTNAHGNIPAGTPWSKILKSVGFAEVLIGPRGGPVDSLIFAIGKPAQMPDSLNTGKPRILLLDTTGCFNAEGKAVMAIFPVYDGGDEGRPTYGEAQIGDRQPPIPVQIDLAVSDRSFRATWNRPIDATSFFDPGADTGIIQSYVLELRAGGGGKFAERAKKLAPHLTYVVGGDTVLPTDSGSTFTTNGVMDGVRYTLPDGDNYHPQGSLESNRIALTIANLTPLDTLNFRIFPVDKAGNRHGVNSGTDYKIILTDTTEPEKPRLQLDTAATTRNRIVLKWTPSRDSLVMDGVLRAAPQPDQGIREYQMRREYLDDSVVLSRSDTVYAAGLAGGATVYQDTLRRLAPGRSYRFVLTARDSSGHRSAPDTLLAQTRSVVFADAEAGWVCPPGFLAMPGKGIIVGDTGTSAQADERPARRPEDGRHRITHVSSFCIEPQEHRDSAGRFMNRLAWNQADSVCRAMAPQDSSRLCSEVQWERACEGGDSLAHLYGYQGDRSDASLLLGECNQGTGDSVPAQQASLRGRQCLTNEGVFDMPGQFSEWVLDPYVENAYQQISRDTLPYGFSFAAPDTVRMFRGGNFLKPNIPASQLQLLARCANRDVPREVRPKYKAECLDTVPGVIAFYGNDFAQHRCARLHDAYRGQAIVDVTPLRDSVRFAVQLAQKVDTVRIEPDAVSRGKLPLSARATTLALAAVIFVDAEGRQHADTLEARELRDTSTAIRRLVLLREAGAGYTPYEVDGRPYVRLLYGYAQTGSRPARLNYASRAIAFRCCAKPRPKPE